MRQWTARQIKLMKVLILEIGLKNALIFRLAQILKTPLVRIKIKDIPIWVRPTREDRRVAILSLDEEFEGLDEYMPSDFNGIIVDAGAYIGSAALKLSEMFPFATIACIEPSSSNFCVLEKNVRHKTNIKTYNAALATKSGSKIILSDRGTGNWGFTTIANPADKPNTVLIEEVSTISIREIKNRLEERQIGLLKMDIEGAEKEIFENCTIDLHEIPLIFVELHDRIINGCMLAFKDFSQRRTVISFGGEKFLSIRNHSNS